MSRDFSSGEGGLVINLETISAQEGDRGARWLWGPMVSESDQGKIVVRAEFLNSKGDVLGKATVTGKIIVGVLGGSFDEAISSAAKQIHEIAVQRFKR